MCRLVVYFLILTSFQYAAPQYVPSRQQANQATSLQNDGQMAGDQAPSYGSFQQQQQEQSQQQQNDAGTYGQPNVGSGGGNFYPSNANANANQANAGLYGTNQQNNGRASEVQGYNSGPTLVSQAVIRPFQGTSSSAQNYVSQGTSAGSASSGNGKDNGNPLNKLNLDYLGSRPDYCKRPSGQFSVAQDCTKFYNCHENIAWIMDCPEGLGFNEAIAACDYADAVGCAAAKTGKSKTNEPAGGYPNNGAGPQNNSPNNNGNSNPGPVNNPGYGGSAGVPQQYPSQAAPGQDNNGQRNNGNQPYPANTNPGYNSPAAGGVSPRFPQQNGNGQPNQNNGGGNIQPGGDSNRGQGPTQFPSGSPQPANFPAVGNNDPNSNSWQNNFRPAVLPPCLAMGGVSQTGGNSQPAPPPQVQFPQQPGVSNGNPPSPVVTNSPSNFDPQTGFAVIEPQRPGQSRPANMPTNPQQTSSGNNNNNNLPDSPVYGPTGPQSSTGARCQPCSQLNGATSCANFPSAKCFDDVCGGCKARFFVARPGAGSQPFAEVTAMCISSNSAGESFPLQDTSNRIQPYR